MSGTACIRVVTAKEIAKSAGGKHMSELITKKCNDGDVAEVILSGGVKRTYVFDAEGKEWLDSQVLLAAVRGLRAERARRESLIDAMRFNIDGKAGFIEFLLSELVRLRKGVVEGRTNGQG